VRIDENWRLLAQSISAMADHLANAVGWSCTPIVFADLPTAPTRGMICCVSDSTTVALGSVISTGGGASTVLAFYNGTNWTVCGV
jgi:hypothetical protein